MIKEKTKREPEITLKQELQGYIKTAGISFLSAVIFTVLLSFHSRSEMIKNLYSNRADRVQIEQQIAKQIVNHADLTSSLTSKNYAVCINVGDLYYAAGDLQRAEYAYHLALEKSPNGTFAAHQKFATVLITQNKTKDAEEVINDVPDINSLKLVRFKTRTYIILGDKYYSESKFLKAAEAYEKANYYYTRLKKRDRYIHESIKKRIVSSYIEAASVIIEKGGSSSDAARFLKKALKYDPDNLNIKYRLALIYADLDPILAIDFFEELMQKIPQEIDYLAFGKALIKAANMMDIQNNQIQAKYYRYRIHSLDLYTQNKVVYKNDINIDLKSLIVKKIFFTYQLRNTYKIKNVSTEDIKKLYVEFVLKKDDKVKQTVVVPCASKKLPLFANDTEGRRLDVVLGSKIFTKRELQHYTVDIYLYKDPKFKTLIGSHIIPQKSYYSSKTRVSPHL